MEKNIKEIYIGIDFGESWTQISYFCEGMKEPETVSTIAGEAKYRISTSLWKRQDFGSWYLGDYSKNKGNLENAVNGLWEKSLKNEVVMLDGQQSYEARELLQLFFRKVLRLVPILKDFGQIKAITFRLAEFDLEGVELLKQVMTQLGIDKKAIFVQDNKESFCHFAMNQKRELMQHDVALFQCEENDLICYYLKKDTKTSPKTVEISTVDLGQLPVEQTERDEVFGQKAASVLQGHIVSAVYLMGNGFDGGWLKESLHIVCKGRKAFQGKNLYTLGACHNSYMQMHKSEMEYIYFGDYMLSHNIFLQSRNKEGMFFLDLAEAGVSCYEVNKQYQVLLQGEPYIDIHIKSPDGKEMRIERLELTGLPKRPPKATRLKIEALSVGKGMIQVKVHDMGFGEWYPSSEKVWEYCINE